MFWCRGLGKGLENQQHSRVVHDFEKGTEKTVKISIPPNPSNGEARHIRQYLQPFRREKIPYICLVLEVFGKDGHKLPMLFLLKPFGNKRQPPTHQPIIYSRIVLNKARKHFLIEKGRKTSLHGAMGDLYTSLTPSSWVSMWLRHGCFETLDAQKKMTAYAHVVCRVCKDVTHHTLIHHTLIHHTLIHHTLTHHPHTLK